MTILGLAEDLSRSLAARRPLEGPFHLGVIPTIAPFLLPKAAARLSREFPKLELYLREDLTASLVKRLADGSLDAAVLALPYEAPGIDWIEFAEDPFLFVAQPDSPLVGKRPVKGADLKSARLLLLEDGHCLREHALDACKLRQSEFTDHYGATSLFTLVQMVRAGLGVTLFARRRRTPTPP